MREYGVRRCSCPLEIPTINVFMDLPLMMVVFDDVFDLDDGFDINGGFALDGVWPLIRFGP